MIKKKRKTVKRKIVKRKTVKKRTVSKKSKTKKPFGGYTISFKNREETLEQVFGKASIPPSQMTKKLWKLLRQRDLVISKIISN